MQVRPEEYRKAKVAVEVAGKPYPSIHAASFARFGFNTKWPERRKDVEFEPFDYPRGRRTYSA
jgi:hypothetical protein